MCMFSMFIHNSHCLQCYLEGNKITGCILARQRQICRNTLLAPRLQDVCKGVVPSSPWGATGVAPLSPVHPPSPVWVCPTAAACSAYLACPQAEQREGAWKRVSEAMQSHRRQPQAVVYLVYCCSPQPANAPFAQVQN